ncbi:hypothetical protein DFR76_101566 [Nocardia pseudobrasiliensis]|uniref:Uncharacterized protein n=1 Tax=Nocardia pseudobrasiliensis TaxID=45979 RepID=A0A370IE84_9NOCA|nr:hypothetical protein DFR76_101566 [Nocardia pseudobrasiliensis]
MPRHRAHNAQDPQILIGPDKLPQPMARLCGPPDCDQPDGRVHLVPGGGGPFADQRAESSPRPPADRSVDVDPGHDMTRWHVLGHHRPSGDITARPDPHTTDHTSTEPDHRIRFDHRRCLVHAPPPQIGASVLVHQVPHHRRALPDNRCVTDEPGHTGIPTDSDTVTPAGWRGSALRLVDDSLGKVAAIGCRPSERVWFGVVSVGWVVAVSATVVALL